LGFRYTNFKKFVDYPQYYQFLNWSLNKARSNRPQTTVCRQTTVHCS